MGPVGALRDRPVGSVPGVTCQVCARVPPVGAKVCEYAESAWPFGNGEVVVMTNVAGWMVKVKFRLAVWTGEPESATLNVSETLATGVLGVPPFRPLSPFKLHPAGRGPECNCTT